MCRCQLYAGMSLALIQLDQVPVKPVVVEFNWSHCFHAIINFSWIGASILRYPNHFLGSLNFAAQMMIRIGIICLSITFLTLSPRVQGGRDSLFPFHLHINPEKEAESMCSSTNSC